MGSTCFHLTFFKQTALGTCPQKLVFLSWRELTASSVTASLSARENPDAWGQQDTKEDPWAPFPMTSPRGLAFPDHRPGSEAGDRWTQQLESLPVDKYSNMKIIAGAKRSWGLPRSEIKNHTFLILEVKETFLTTHSQKDSLEVIKGGMPPHSRWCRPTHRPLH